jgi:hypothetical protein
MQCSVETLHIRHVMFFFPRLMPRMCVPLICVSFRLYDKRVSATSTLPSIFFSLHPFPNICRAVLQLHTIRFATREKPNYVAVDEANVFQI